MPVNEEMCLKVVCDDDGIAVGVVWCKRSEVPDDYVDIFLLKPNGPEVDLATLDRMICSDVLCPDDIPSLSAHVAAVGRGLARFVMRALCKGRTDG